MGFFKSLGRGLVGAGKGYVASGGSPWGAAAGGAMGLFGGGSGQNPANAAMGYLNQIPNMAQGYLNPYSEEGNKAYHSLLDQYSNRSASNPNQFPNEYSQMARDPNDFINNLMKGYESSRGYNYKQKKMLSEARNTAASGGFAGTQYDQANQSELIRDLLGSDMHEYLTNVMNIQNKGLEGEERRLMGRERALTGATDRGYNASSDLASILGSNMMAQAGLRFQGQREENLERARRRDNRMELFGDLFNPVNKKKYGDPSGKLSDLLNSFGGMSGFGG